MAGNAIDAINKAEKEADEIVDKANNAKNETLKEAREFGQTLIERAVADAAAAADEITQKERIEERKELEAMALDNKKELERIEVAAKKRMDEAVKAIIGRI